MYSYGSSARTSGGKRGHGGRPYRPPPDRKNSQQPPKMKACNCLIELDVEEYRTAAQSRQHICLGGIDQVGKIMKTIRTLFRCHLELPGRRASEQPVAIVGATYHETVAAAAWFVEKLQPHGYDHVHGRIRRNVKDLQNVPVEGVFFKSQQKTAWMFFRSPNWSVVAYYLSNNDGSTQSNGSQQKQPHEEEIALRTCFDNLQFRLGSRLENSDIFVSPTRTQTTVFAALASDSATQLLHEIETIDTPRETKEEK